MFRKGFLEEPSVGCNILIPTYIFHFAPQPFRFKARLSGSAYPDLTIARLSGSVCLALALRDLASRPKQAAFALTSDQEYWRTMQLAEIAGVRYGVDGSVYTVRCSPDIIEEPTHHHHHHTVFPRWTRRLSFATSSSSSIAFSRSDSRGAQTHFQRIATTVLVLTVASC